jgi:hypothetical protein
LNEKIFIIILFSCCPLSALAKDQTAQCKEASKQYKMEKEEWCVGAVNEGEFSDNFACIQGVDALDKLNESKEKARQYYVHNCLQKK